MVQAVDGVSLHIGKGETLAVVGESGCGKTVTARTVMKLIDMPPGKIVEGQVLWRGRDLVPLDSKEMDKIRAREIGMICQEPMTSPNPVYTVGDQIAERCACTRSCRAGGAGRRGGNARPRADPQRGAARQRLPAPVLRRHAPARMTPWRCLAAAADRRRADHGARRHYQAQILELLTDMKARFGMSIMLITHAMGVVAETAQRVVVMYAGKVAEEAPVESLFENPRHPYTQGLIRSIPRVDSSQRGHERLEQIPGTVPSLLNPPPGCRFAARCKFARAQCLEGQPPLIEVAPGHRVACILYEGQGGDAGRAAA